MKDKKVETLVMNETQSAVEIFEKYGIKASIDNNGEITISHYCQPKNTTFAELGIDENELIKNVRVCQGKFETIKSKLTTFPLVLAKEVILDENTDIKEMPNLKAVGIFVVNKNLKKAPKLKLAASISLENAVIKSFPKLKNAGVIISQNSMLEDLSSLEEVSKLCVIDSSKIDLKSLKKAEDVFVCSSDENKKIDLKTLPNLEQINNLFIANSNFKSFPKLKKAQKIALYNSEIKNVKSSIKAEVEIKTQISDSELEEKFDNFTNWYNSELLEQSMELLGGIVSSYNQ